MTYKQLLEQALEALELANYKVADYCNGYTIEEVDDAITAIKQALAAPMQEPSEWQKIECPICGDMAIAKDIPAASVHQCMEHGECFGGKCIYTTPPAAPVQEPVAQGVRFHERLAQNKTALEKMAAKNRHVAYVCPQCMWTLEEKEEGDWGEHPDRLMGRIDGVSAPMQPEQEPVATVIGKYLDRRDVLYTCIDKDLPLLTSLYTTPPAAQRQWVGLTAEDMATCIDEPAWDLVLRKAEQILKEKNT